MPGHLIADPFEVIELRKVILVQHEAAGTISVDVLTLNSINASLYPIAKATSTTSITNTHTY